MLAQICKYTLYFLFSFILPLHHLSLHRSTRSSLPCGRRGARPLAPVIWSPSARRLASKRNTMTTASPSPRPMARLGDSLPNSHVAQGDCRTRENIAAAGARPCRLHLMGTLCAARVKGARGSSPGAGGAERSDWLPAFHGLDYLHLDLELSSTPLKFLSSPAGLSCLLPKLAFSHRWRSLAAQQA